MFELEEELSRVEMDEEDDKAMGKEVPEEDVEAIAEVSGWWSWRDSSDSLQKKQTIKWMAFRQARRLYPAEVAKLGNAVGADRDLHQLVKLIREREAAASAARQAPGHDSVPPEEAHEDGDGVDPVAEEEVEGADTPADGGEEAEAADAEAKGDEEADLEEGKEDAEDKVNGASHEASQAASPEKEQEQVVNGHAEGDAEAMAVDPAPEEQAEEQPVVEVAAVYEPIAAPIIDEDMAEAE